MTDLKDMQQIDMAEYGNVSGGQGLSSSKDGIEGLIAVVSHDSAEEIATGEGRSLLPVFAEENNYPLGTSLAPPIIAPSATAASVEEDSVAVQKNTVDSSTALEDKASESAEVAPHPSLKPRCLEEQHAIIIRRSTSAAAKCSNTKYKCLYCPFTFVGGPQKIRVHLTGKKENGTRLSKCDNCPEEVRQLLEKRMRGPRDKLSSPSDKEDEGLPSRNAEEQHCIILSRSPANSAKSANSRYRCIYCR